VTSPDERAFPLLDRGVVRDEIILASFRNALRVIPNPETGVPFTEDEIAIATQEGSRWWIEADAIDLFGQVVQGRDLYFVQQLDPRTANTNWLRNFHAVLWDVTPLPAQGGSGDCTASATAGSIFLGSTTIGDPSVAVARDAAGSLYQVTVTVTTPVSGSAELVLRGVTTGTKTNPRAGTILTWVENQPLGAEPTFVVADSFTGGIDDENDADLANRIVDKLRFRPAAGNNAQVRAWARAANAAVERAFVYATALHAGSALVTVTQKRGATVGPLARIPSAGTLADVTNYLTPPGSPVVPGRWHLLVTPPTTINNFVDATLLLSMRRGTRGGWADYSPWPVFSVGFPYGARITTVTNQTHFRVTTDVGLPGGAASLSGALAPQVMVWHPALSRYEKLAVESVTDAGSNHFDFVLSQATELASISTAIPVCPYTTRLQAIAVAAEQYFDTLGPGEVIDLSADSRSDRAFRFPEPTQEFPSQAGQGIVAYIGDALGAALGVSSLETLVPTAPAVPTDPASGPAILVLGTLAVYELTT
jgi:hypothetical protein